MESARAVFAKHGYAGATVEEIAESAGYSRGAFYSNFESLEELFCRLLEESFQRQATAVGRILAEELPIAERLRRVREFYVSYNSEDDICLLATEFQLHAVRHPVFRERVERLFREDRERTDALVRQFADQLGRPLPLPVETVTMALIALSQGSYLWASVEPDRFSKESMREILGGLFDLITGTNR